MELKIHFIEDGDSPRPYDDVLFWTDGNDLPLIGYMMTGNSRLWGSNNADGNLVDVYGDVVCWMRLPEKPKRVGSK